MDKFIIGSMRHNAGKTSLIIGLASALKRRFGYMKPFGARLIYKKKRLWDYDAALMTHIFKLDEAPEDMSIGFHHSKLLHSMNEKETTEKLLEISGNISRTKDLIFVEAEEDICYGTSVHLDAISLTKTLKGRLLIVLSGQVDTMLDDLTFLTKNIRMDGLNFMGVVINMVENIDDFNIFYRPRIEKMKIPVLGVIPEISQLSYISAGYIADRIFAKILAGEPGLNRQVRDIVVGSMGKDRAKKSPLFQDHQAVVASGDRSDLISSSLENNVAAIILSNNIMPPSTIISKAEELGIPLLLVSTDTYQTVKQINELEPLPTKDDPGKIGIIEKMVKDHVDMKAFEKNGHV